MYQLHFATNLLYMWIPNKMLIKTQFKKSKNGKKKQIVTQQSDHK